MKGKKSLGNLAEYWRLPPQAQAPIREAAFPPRCAECGAEDAPFECWFCEHPICPQCLRHEAFDKDGQVDVCKSCHEVAWIEEVARERYGSAFKIIIGSYGVRWLPHHGASGGVSLASRQRASRFAHLATVLRPRLPGYRSAERCGLWPGSLQRIVTVELEGDESKGWLIATCELYSGSEGN